ncbi:MAG: HAD hydrolase-like protein [Microbacteriaceae bacterium]|nr:HAD hydrolase-like protein [Microbacteriaceae bacterium]
MNPAWTCILFDLDGTITDSAPGITASLAWLFETLGRPVPTPADLLRYVGPPLLEGFRDLAGFDAAESAEALALYRTHYVSTGLYDSSVYSGVAGVLGAIHSSGIPMSLATSKPESSARLILDHFGLTQNFDIITGASEDEVRSAKADVVAEALLRLRAAGADTSNPVLVGDREHDVLGAAEHGVPTIFVRWGYGSPAEEVGCFAAVDYPSELAILLLEERQPLSA